MSDVFGRALLDWARGATVPEIVEREDGFTQVGAGPEVYLAPFREWPVAERRALRLVRGRALDVGCGAGRVSLELQGRGVEVVGLDSSRLALEAAGLCGVRRLERRSIERLGAVIGEFDSLIFFGNNFGLFGTPEHAKELLSEWSAKAKPGTRLLLESTSAYFGGAPGFDRGYYRRNRDLGRPPGQVRLRYHYEGRTGPWFSWLFVSKRELGELVRGTGWRFASVVPGALAEPYVAILEREAP